MGVNNRASCVESMVDYLSFCTFAVISVYEYQSGRVWFCKGKKKLFQLS